MRGAAPILCILLALLAGCGWHLVGRGAGALDPRVEVIAVPLLENDTQQDEVAMRFTEAITNEFVRRGRYKVVSTDTSADAVLEGRIRTYETVNIEFDDDGTVTRQEVRITAAFTFRNLIAGRVEWENSAFAFRAEYDVTGDPETYTDLEVVAIEVVAREFALSVVSQILEGF
jgi:hypothetical protein